MWAASPRGPAPVSVDEELARVLPVVRALAQRDVCVSIDTRHAEVARACLEAGAAIVNDVSGFRDPAMVDAVRDSDCGLVVMHMQGDPSTMQNAPTYDDVVADVREWLPLWRLRASRTTASASTPVPASARRRRRRWSWCATSKSSCAWATR